MEKKRSKTLLSFAVACVLCLSLALIGVSTRFGARADEVQPLTDEQLELVTAAGWFGDDNVTELDLTDPTYDSAAGICTYDVEIGAAEELARLAYLVYRNETVQNTDTSDTTQYKAAYNVTLTADIDLGNKLWIPVGTTSRAAAGALSNVFRGNVNGNRKTVSGLSSLPFRDHMAYNSTDKFYIDCGSGKKIPFEARKNEEYVYGLFGTTYDACFADLTVDRVSIDLGDKPDLGNGKTLINDSVGAIVGYNLGNFSMENCTAGSETDGSYIKRTYCSGGLVGRAYTQATDDPAVGEISFENCVNYIDVGTLDYTREKSGGILGFAAYFADITMTRCVNYGEIIGRYAGGITAHFTNAGSHLGDMSVIDCVNYGDVTGIYSGGNAGAGGAVGLVQMNRSKAVKDVLIQNFVNYGAVKSNYWAGGITAWVQSYETGLSGVPQNVTFENCYNYGDVYGLARGTMIGGMVGWGDTIGNLSISGGFGGKIASLTDSAVSEMTAGACIASNQSFVADGFVNAGYIQSGANATETRVHAVPHEFYDASSVTEDEVFAYANADKETVIGFASALQDRPTRVEIPEGVKAIGNWAFAGENVTELSLPQSLQRIGSAAFADTGLTAISLPVGLQRIGQSAFARCAFASNYIELWEGAENTEFGNYVFGGGDFFTVAQDEAQYRALARRGALADYLTYYVPVTYHVLHGAQAGAESTENKLFGYAYGYVCTDGVWQNNRQFIGTSDLGGATTQWFHGENLDMALTMEQMNEMLKASGVLSVDLYADEVGKGATFVAREDVVFDGTRYGVNQINALLAASSKKVTDETVTITGYKLPNGTDATTPSVFYNAGTYTVTIGTEEIEIAIGRQKIDLSSASRLEWMVRYGYTSERLLDRTVYVYTKAGGVKFPSTTLQSGMGDPVTVHAIGSVARRHDGETLTLQVIQNGFNASFENESGETAGVYTTTVTLTALDNYVLAYDGAVVDGEGRGLEVTLNADGTATVKKTWYIVDMENWLVNARGNDYAIATHAYGETFDVSMPRLAFGQNDFLASGKSFVYTLTRGNTAFEPFYGADFDKYFNNTMPSGEYTLRISVPAFSYYATYNNGVPDENSLTECEAFTEMISFTVTEGQFSASAVSELNAALYGKEISFVLGESTTASARIDEAVRAALQTAKDARPNTSVAGNVWASYYVAPYLTFNLASDKNNEFGQFTDPVQAGVYTYYYKLTAPNYEDVASDTDGNYLSFTVTAYGTVHDLPSAADIAKSYNGGLQKADVAGTAEYTVTKNDGGIDAGDYELVLTLIHPECWLWEGQSVSNKTDTYTLTFTIATATNDWVVKPTVQNWVVGKWKESENLVQGSALFGYENMTFEVTNTGKNQKVLFDSSKDDIQKLKGLGAGDYYIRVRIEGTDSYNGLESAMLFHVYKAPGMPWWGILLVVLGTLAVAAAILLILWKTGVIQLLTDKIVLAIRTRASVDATIASVRAQKREDEARLSVAKAERAEKAAARRAALKAEREKPAEERAAALEAKAQAQAERAEKMRLRAEAMQERAAALRAEREAAATSDEKKE